MTRRTIAAIAAALLVVGACSGDGDGDDQGLVTAPEETSTTQPPRTTESTTTTADPDAELKAEIEAAYLAEWDAFLEIFRDPDPSNPLIDAHYTELAREQILDAISRDVLNGHALRMPDDPSNWEVVVANVDIEGPARAVVAACIVDGLVVYDVGSGEIVSDDVVVSTNTAELTFVDSRWKTASSQSLEVEGADGCDE